MTRIASTTDDLAWLDATAQADLVRQGEVTPIELLDAAITRIEKLDGELNAVVSRRFEQARREAVTVQNGPFRGVPMLLKDFLCHTAGDPVHGGMRVLHDRDWRAKEDSYLAARLRTAGFLFCGRTNTPELATSITTEPLLYGATHNPWDLSRTPGGSSGGSAAAVAAGLVAVAHGNDMAGSIRIPASACGIVGLKPSRARTTMGPQHGDYWGYVTHEHVLSRSVRDTAAVLDAIAARPPATRTPRPRPSGPTGSNSTTNPVRCESASAPPHRHPPRRPTPTASRPSTTPHACSNPSATTSNPPKQRHWTHPACSTPWRRCSPP